MKFLKEKGTISEMKISFDGISSRLESSEEKIRELLIIAIKTSETEAWREKKSDLEKV